MKRGTSLLLLNVVELVVPEEGLVSVAPEELVASNVLVLVLSRELVIGKAGVSVVVVKVLLLNNVGVVGSSKNNGSDDKDGDLHPQVGGLGRVVSGLLLESDVFLSSNGVGGVGESGTDLALVASLGMNRVHASGGEEGSTFSESAGKHCGSCARLWVGWWGRRDGSKGRKERKREGGKGKNFRCNWRTLISGQEVVPYSSRNLVMADNSNKVWPVSGQIMGSREDDW